MQDVLDHKAPQGEQALRVSVDPQALRADQVLRVRLGSLVAPDRRVQQDSLALREALAQLELQVRHYQI